MPLATLTAMGLPMLYENDSANNPTAAYLVSVGVLPGNASLYQTMFTHAYRIGYWNQKTESKAAYFQGTMQVSDSVSVTAGVRYVEERKHIRAGTCIGTDTTGMQTCNPNAFLAAIMGATFDTWAHNFDNIPERNTSHMLPSLIIKKDLDDNNMITPVFLKVIRVVVSTQRMTRILNSYWSMVRLFQILQCQVLGLNTKTRPQYRMRLEASTHFQTLDCNLTGPLHMQIMTISKYQPLLV